jgi:HK97 family phage prohead protease/HK97 family phage major capsid protein
MKDIKNKVFHLDSQFTKELPTAGDAIDNILIAGYASANVPDRAGDVVPSSVWDKGMENYLKNPIILAYHDHDDPVGRMIEHKVDSKGLWVKARISAAAGEVFSLVKDGVLTAFSVAFRIIDAEYNAVTELFVIKELELIEISVVSIPCNQETLFSLSKSFDSDDEYNLFKQQFAPDSDSAKGLESSTVAKGKTLKEIGMDPKELQAMLDKAANAAAEAATKRFEEKHAEQAAEVAKKAADEAEMQKRIAEAVAAITPSTTGAEALLKEIEKRANEQTEASKKLLEGLEGTINEKKAELEAIQKSRMTFGDGSKAGEMPYEDREKAFLLSKVTGKSIESTKFGSALIQKFGQHLPSATWELEVSLNMEAEVRRKLVVAPILRNISMPTNVMTIPVNPEAGLASWVANTAFGTTTSAGGTTATGGSGSPHLLKEITLNAYKVASMEYLNYEEEEDSLIVLMPIIRDAMVRRVSRAMDNAFLLGATNPVKGLAAYDATSAVVATNIGSATVANLVSLRRDLGAWGLDPAEVTFIVSTDVYYDLLADTTFQTMNQVGAKATLLTGQVGSIGNSPVLVSAEFPTKAGGTTSATTNYAAIAVASSNFIVGNQRGLRFDTQDLVETQRKVLVASLRTGMTQISTNMGQGVSVLRWS